MTKIAATFAAIIELALRQYEGPFAATITMDNGEVWQGRVIGLRRDGEDEETWVTLNPVWTIAHGSGTQCGLRTSRMKELHCEEAEP